jgi:hypothetical protein
MPTLPKLPTLPTLKRQFWSPDRSRTDVAKLRFFNVGNVGNLGNVGNM